MPPEISLRIDGVAVSVDAEISLAAALARVGQDAMRRSLGDAPRGAFCGMGICFECRVRVDGCERLACLTRVAAGMEVHTHA
jgi:aerobic-type carbon monoxide dehydrogenase small subunit (CoxS/CutS family)